MLMCFMCCPGEWAGEWAGEWPPPEPPGTTPEPPPVPSAPSGQLFVLAHSLNTQRVGIDYKELAELTKAWLSSHSQSWLSFTL